jgi:hypothetical protein
MTSKVLFAIALTALCCLSLGYMAYSQAFKAYEANGAYNSAREQLEALQRTMGHVDMAYRCFKR